MTKANATPKKVKVEKEVVAKSSAKLITYEIKAVIPTGPYANIQPCILVSANTIQEASEFVIPHLDELFEKYLNISERPKPRVTVKEFVPQPTAPVEVPKETLVPLTTTTPQVKVEVQTLTNPLTVEQLQEGATVPVEVAPAQVYPDPNSPMGKAKSAVESCKSIEALNLINTRIQESVKLDALDKADLDVIVKAKRIELSK